MLEFVEGKQYKYHEIFGAIIRELNLKFPFKPAHKMIRNLVRSGKLERIIIITRGGRRRIKYRVPIIDYDSWTELTYVYTFVATRRTEKIIGKGKAKKRVRVMRKIEIHTIAVCPTELIEEAKILIEGATERVTRAEDYGFVYDEPNIGAGGSFRERYKQKKRPKVFMASYSCYDHTYNRDKARDNFELPDNWWLLNSEELSQIFIDNVTFTLLTRGMQTKLK